ncbi:hypothetical protein ACO0K9_16335 [Undibacterium sp. Ji50W]|uniref:hypothetical protein n=1 Tax=Undibacterium sp. Ji50W TaxID=3413041 RepID=UPI003BEF6644
MAQKNPIPAKPSPASTSPKDAAVAHSFFRDDFPVIRKASIKLGICIVIALILVGGSQLVLLKQEAINLQAQTELDQAQGKYTLAVNEKNDIREFQPRYVQLMRRGFVGDENRLDIIEYVHSIQESRKLLPIAYEIFPQKNFQLDPSISIGELELRGSKLVVKMGLLHELDMLTFLTDLSAKGILSPQACSLKAIEAAKDKLLSARLEAECTLYWITMGRPVPASKESQ